MISIVDQADFDQLLKEQKTFVIFKHSPSCSISARAHEIMADFQALAVYIVDVIADRNISQYIASATGIKHESPQLILLLKGVAHDSVSHYAIDETLLSERVAQAS